MKRTRRQLLIDQLAGKLLEHADAPLLQPERAVAVALSMVPYRWSGKPLSETSLPVRLALQAIDKAGYDIVPRKSRS